MGDLRTIDISSKLSLETEVPSTGGNSGSPLLDKDGYVLGITHRVNMYHSLFLAAVQLDLCNVLDASKDPDRIELAVKLRANNGLCEKFNQFLVTDQIDLKSESTEALTKKWIDWLWKYEVPQEEKN